MNTSLLVSESKCWEVGFECVLNIFNRTGCYLGENKSISVVGATVPFLGCKPSQ